MVQKSAGTLRSFSFISDLDILETHAGGGTYPVPVADAIPHSSTSVA